MRRVAVAMGGPSSEYEVSLQSGIAVVNNLKKAGFDVLPMWIDRDLGVRFCMPNQADPPGAVVLWDSLKTLKDRVDCVFIAMHGSFGEDGVFQAILTANGIGFSGSDHIGAALAIDKIVSKRLYQSVGLLVPPFRAFHAVRCLADPKGVAAEALQVLGLPMVIKSPRLGSSFGIRLVNSEGELATAFAELAENSSHVLAEAFIEGREITVPVLDTPHGPRALPLIEIRVHEHDFFDYETKYDPKLADEICPAPIEESLAKRLSEMGIVAHNVLMQRGFSRSDFIVTPKGSCYILETNSIPGLTEVSLFPKAAAAAGISFPDLLSQLCDQSDKG